MQKIVLLILASTHDAVNRTIGLFELFLFPVRNIHVNGMFDACGTTLATVGFHPGRLHVERRKPPSADTTGKPRGMATETGLVYFVVA